MRNKFKIILPNKVQFKCNKRNNTVFKKSKTKLNSEDKQYVYMYALYKPTNR